MREIKFRGKRIDDGRWVYGQYFMTPLTDENSGTKPEDGWFFLCGESRHCIVQDGASFVIDVETLGQYTGLKGKNGKEIYEDDILKTPCDIEGSIHGSYSFQEVIYRNGTWIVQYLKSETGFKLPRGYTAGLLIDAYDHDMESLVFYDNSLESTEIEVIGNIYENPELLEGNTP